MNKFRYEPFITQRLGKKGWSFQVYIRTDFTTFTKTFSERYYGSARVAFDTAVRYKNKKLVEIADKTIFALSNKTVKDVFEECIDKSPNSLNTKNHHEKTFNKYIPCKDKKIQELTKADIIDNLNSLVYTSTDDTIGRVLTIWKDDIVGFALNNEYIIRDLTAGIKKPKSKLLISKRDTNTSRDTVLEIEKHLMMLDGKRERDAQLCIYMLEILYYTGARPAEVSALKREDIFDDHISINKQIGSSDTELETITRCKTQKSVREVPIHPNLKPTLDALLEFTDEDYLFMRDGKFMNARVAREIINYAIKGKNIRFTLYMLRHNMATELVSHHTDARTTMDILGHARYDMSLEYANSSKQQKEKAISLLS